MKSMISYYFCEKYGERQQEYLNPRNYTQGHTVMHALRASGLRPIRYTLTKKNTNDVTKLVYSP